MAEQISKTLLDNLTLDLNAIAAEGQKVSDSVIVGQAHIALNRFSGVQVIDNTPVGPTTKPTAPTGLKITPGDTKLDLVWNGNPTSEAVDRYQVYLNNSSSFVETTINKYTISGLTNGTKYTIRISAHNKLGYGPWSATPGTGTPVGGTPTPDPDPPPPPPPPPSGTATAETRPFDPSHPVYQPIPANCQLDQYSDLIAAYIKSKGNFSFDTGDDSPAIYVGKVSDPIYTASIAGKSFSIHCPVTAKAGSGVDHPVIILDAVSKIEYRMWQASINHSNRTISCSNGGVGSYRNDGSLDANKKRALGQAEIFGSNTGSGESYTVGMIRPIDVQNGRIDHAIRIAAAFLSDHRYNWPALRTEGGANSGYLTSETKGCPMGARIFLDPSVDVVALGNAAAAKVSDSRAKNFLKILVKAIQEFGLITLDGTGGGMNFYFEGNDSAQWATLLGPVNSYGSYNDLARALLSVLPFDKLRVAAPSVFDKVFRQDADSLNIAYEC